MALTRCTDCGQPVSTHAHACPHCGAPPPGALRHTAWGVAVTAALTAATLALTVAWARKDVWGDLVVAAAVIGPTAVLALVAVRARRG